MRALQAVRSQLEPGMVYRRADLSKWSNAVDRHLTQLQNDKTLVKLSGGLYFCPKETVFGAAPPRDRDLVEGFLKDGRFLLMSPSSYNRLGVGSTQLYNETVVYNHKRHGRFKLGNRYFQFVIKHFFPLELTDEFLLVDLVDNLSKLAENRDLMLNRVKAKALSLNYKNLKAAIDNYGNVRTKKLFSTLFLGETFDR